MIWQKIIFLLGIVEGHLRNITEMNKYFSLCNSLGGKYFEQINDFKEQQWLKMYSLGEVAFQNKKYSIARKAFADAKELKPLDESTVQKLSEAIEMSEKDSNSQDKKSFSEFKDIEGFHKFSWEMSSTEIRELLQKEKYLYVINDSVSSEIEVDGYVFQNEKATILMRLYKDALYQISVVYHTQANVVGLQKYYSNAEQLVTVYGSSKKVFIGNEGVNIQERIQNLILGNLIYQYSWATPSGKLVFQLIGNDINTLTHSLFYASRKEEYINKILLRDEF